MSILNWTYLEVPRDTSEWLVVHELPVFPDHFPVIRRRLLSKPIEGMVIGRPVQFDSLDLSLLLCYFFLSNYDLHTKYSTCLSEQNGCSAQLWASLVHYKSRL